MAHYSGRVAVVHEGRPLGKAAVYLVSSDRSDNDWTGTAHGPAIGFPTLVNETVELLLPSGEAVKAVVASYDPDAGDAALHGASPAKF